MNVVLPLGHYLLSVPLSDEIEVLNSSRDGVHVQGGWELVFVSGVRDVKPLPDTILFLRPQLLINLLQIKRIIKSRLPRRYLNLTNRVLLDKLLYQTKFLHQPRLFLLLNSHNPTKLTLSCLSLAELDS